MPSFVDAEPFTVRPPKPHGAVTFTSLEARTGIWSLPFHGNLGSPTGPLEQVTTGPARRDTPFLSSNERYVAFTSNQTGQFNIWIRDLATGKETILAPSSFVQRYPVLNMSGTKVAFSVYEKDKRVVYVSAPGGTPEKLCEGCLRTMDWSRDEKTILVHGGAPFHISLLDLASHRQTLILTHPTHNLIYGRFSPDNRWVSFTERIQPNLGRITIAPVDGARPVPETAWISIAGVASDDYAHWSPDGRTLYFTSPKDGYSCLWGQRIAPGSHRPVGEPFAVQHFHGRVSFGHGGWSLSPNRIAIALVETTGNVWMMSPSH